MVWRGEEVGVPCASVTPALPFLLGPFPKWDFIFHTKSLSFDLKVDQICVQVTSAQYPFCVSPGQTAVLTWPLLISRATPQ